jgi:Zn-dependent peptidase ImmA (M78 family)
MMQSPKVRFLQPQEIESAVRELLHAFAKGRGIPIVPPIPVDDIIEKHLKVRLEISDLVARLGVTDVLGATWFDDGIIRVDERLEAQEGRLSFTLGHEVGHWVLHRPQLEADKVAPLLLQNQEAPPAVVCRTSERKAPAEWQADQFASRLLLPERFVREAFTAAIGSDHVGIDGLRARRDTAEVNARWREVAASVVAAGNFSNVSNEAMRYRLEGLGLVRDGDQRGLGFV